jgi:hypothetical protein
MAKILYVYHALILSNSKIKIFEFEMLNEKITIINFPRTNQVMYLSLDITH